MTRRVVTPHSEQTRNWLRRAAARFDADGLSYWTVRRRDDATIVGVGGAQRQRTGAWNINYRIHTDHQGQGLASELARMAVTLATELDGSVPVIAWIAEHNIPSRRVAENVGLVNRGFAVDPSDHTRRLAYADRSVQGFTGSS